jgi:hypothetical protein
MSKYSLNINKKLVNEILINLLKKEKIQNKNYEPMITQYLWNQAINGIFYICKQCSLVIDTAFLAVALFEKCNKTGDNYICLALMCISVAAKLDDPNESSINFSILYNHAQKLVHDDMWKNHIDFVSLENLNDYEKIILQRLDYNIYIVTPIIYSNIYLGLLFGFDKITDLILNQLNNLLIFIKGISIMKKYLPSSLCLAAIYYLYRTDPNKKSIEILPGFNIIEILKINKEIEEEIIFERLLNSRLGISSPIF